MDSDLLQVGRDRPYIRLPEPHSNIIIATPRMEDVDPSVRILNDPRVLKWVLGTTSPYTTTRAEGWIEGVKSTADALLLKKDTFVDGCPFRHIMELKPDGSYEFLGDIGISRSNWTDVVDPGDREKLLNENNARVDGDPGIVFQIGYYLSPTHHRRGIMTAVLSALLNQWAIPRMNAHKIRATPFHGNFRSRGFLVKNGFVLTRTVQNYQELDGEVLDMCIFEWNRT
ncbi:acyl-CoA N-acyltransferase [Marasmius fiardii PR-910]|nr:acyl-CoA N-acyltransferase [Marasmius fiardii PR-910]